MQTIRVMVQEGIYHSAQFRVEKFQVSDQWNSEKLVSHLNASAESRRKLFPQLPNQIRKYEVIPE